MSEEDKKEPAEIGIPPDQLLQMLSDSAVLCAQFVAAGIGSNFLVQMTAATQYMVLQAFEKGASLDDLDSFINKISSDIRFMWNGANDAYRMHKETAELRSMPTEGSA
jgi:hypothetical protein